MTTTADDPDLDDAPGVSPRHFGLAVAALAMGGFAIGTTEFVTMGLLPQIARGVDVSIPTGGHVISVYALGVVVGAPVIAFLGARLPRRALLVGLMVAFALGNAASALAPSYAVNQKSAKRTSRSAMNASSWKTPPSSRRSSTISVTRR